MQKLGCVGREARVKGLRNGKVKFETGQEGVRPSPSSPTDYFSSREKAREVSSIKVKCVESNQVKKSPGLWKFHEQACSECETLPSAKHKTINYRLKEFSPVQPPNHMLRHCELIKRNSTFLRAGTVIEFQFIHKSSATSIKFQIEQLSLSMWIELYLTIACVMKVFVWLSLVVVDISGKNCMVSRSIKSHSGNGK